MSAELMVEQPAKASTKLVHHSWQVPTDGHGKRLDLYLKQRIGRISRERAKAIVAAGDLLVNCHAVRPSYRLREGQLLTLRRFAPDQEADVLRHDVLVLYEDADLLAVHKPAGLAVHPTAKDLYETLTYWLRRNYPDEPIHPCHRLDRETSGILLCARNKRAEAACKSAFMNGSIEKEYLAICQGHLKDPQVIDAPLALQGRRGLVSIRMVIDAGGMPACTHLHPRKYDPQSDRTLVLCTPKTGRQHQIRAHLASIGHPIVGDKLYQMGDLFFDAYCQKKADLTPATLPHPRHALHAFRLSLCLERPLTITCPMPEDLLGLMHVR